MNFKEFALAASGTDKDGNSRGFLTLFLESWSSDGSEPTRISEMTFERPILKIFKHINYVVVECLYLSKYEAEYRTMISTLNELYRPENSVEIISTEAGEVFTYPQLLVNISAYELGEEYYLLGSLGLEPNSFSYFYDPIVENVKIKLIFSREQIDLFTKTEQV